MKLKNWFWGIFLILAGILIVASQMGLLGQLGFWSILASVLLVAMLVKSLLKLNYYGILLSGALGYLLYQKPMEWYYISPWILIFAAILVGAGLSTIFRKKPKWMTQSECSGQHGCYVSSNKTEKSYGGSGPQTQQEQNEDDNHPYIAIKFGSASRFLHSSSLQDGQFHTSFGKLEVYFDQASLHPDGAEIYLECSFGEIKLYVPRHWYVVNSISTTLGDTNLKTANEFRQDGAPVLTLSGNVTLGEVKIISI